MPTASHVLLCAALLATRVTSTANENGFGRFEKRLQNDNVTNTAVSSTSTVMSNVLPSADISSLDISDFDLALTSTSSYSSSSSPPYSYALDGVVIVSEPQPSRSEMDLGTITTLTRPTLIYPSSAKKTSPNAITTSVISGPTHSSYLSTQAYNFTTYSRPSLNTTSSRWNWNTTANATIATPTVTTTVWTFPPDTTRTTLTTDESGCPSSVGGPQIVTSYSIVHTSTVTFTGNSTDYTPPFPTIVTPTWCGPHLTATGVFSVSVCDGSGESCSLAHPSSTGYGTVPGATRTTKWYTPSSAEATTVVVTTTDKNPAVVFTTADPPDYGASGGTSPNDHDSPDGDDDDAAATTPEYGMVPSNTQPSESTPTPAPGIAVPADVVPVTIGVQPGGVVINDQMFTDKPGHQTSTVVVDGSTFTIDASKVVGNGATVTRPANAGGVFAGSSTTTTVEGLQVIYGDSSVATIGGTAFSISSTPTSVVVNGHSIVIGPEGIEFPSQTIPLITGSGPTEAAVMGGELITAIGTDKVVIDGTTITYGSGSGSSSTQTEVIDGDTILIGPSGVVVHGQTLGGVTAAPSATAYEMVGGATITQIGSTAVVIGGVMFRVGAGATPTTTVIDGQTLTIGPDGVAMSTWTFASPYASTTTIVPGGNAAMAAATATATDDDENGGPMARPSWDVGSVSCIAAGVGFLGPLLFWF